LLFIYIFALLGMELFAHRCKFDAEEQLVTDVAAGVTQGAVMLSPRENFDQCYMSMTTVFIVILGEDWPIVMTNYTRGESSLYVLYFLVVYGFGNFILLSLFTAILLGNTSLEAHGDENIAEKMKAL
jgi:voltage-dependent calcium channel L type alpha-1D